VPVASERVFEVMTFAQHAQGLDHPPDVLARFRQAADGQQTRARRTRRARPWRRALAKACPGRG
jgi:hypothetical protein